jgi:RNA polymerase sigma-70 factor (ECF subfamily)
VTQPARVDIAEPPDLVLSRGFLGGDEAAFRLLYHRHTPRRRMIIRRLLGDRTADVEDVLQETWLAGGRGLHTCHGTGSAEPRFALAVLPCGS